YLALPILVPAFFLIGYALHHGVIEWASHGKEQNVLLVTLGLAIIIDNLALYFWTSTTRTVDLPYGFAVVDLRVALIPVPRVVAFVGALALAGALSLFMARTDLGKAIRAVAKERDGAKLVGI